VGRSAHVARPADVVTNIPSLPKCAHVGIGSIFRGFGNPNPVAAGQIRRHGLGPSIAEDILGASRTTQFTPATNRQLLKARTCLRSVA
jgi:hypothetical protein